MLNMFVCLNFTIMKKLILIFFLGIFWVGGHYAQENKAMKLPPPDMHREMRSFMQALSFRASARTFDTAALSIQDLSDLLWAANGVNRPEEKKRTAPSAMNAQDVDIYLFTAKEVFLYDAFHHALIKVATGDYRTDLAAGQDFVTRAPIVLLLVSDLSRFPRGTEDQKKQWAAMDVGIVSQNIALFCSAAGWRSRPRAFMHIARLREVLHMSETMEPLLNVPVSY